MELRASMIAVLLASCCAGCGASQPCMVQSPAVASPRASDDGLDALSPKDLALRMMADMGSKDISARILDAMVAKFRKMPDLPQGFLDRFAANAHADSSAMEEHLIEIFVNTYDKETLIASVRFYESPAGRKVTAAMPTVMQQSMAAGEAWGRELAEKTIEELRAGSPAK